MAVISFTVWIPTRTTLRRLATRSAAGAITGRCRVEKWHGDRLPYIDNLVNLVVVEDTTVSTDELMRVLAPSGVAYIRRGDTWTKTVKAAPR